MSINRRIRLRSRPSAMEGIREDTRWQTPVMDWAHLPKTPPLPVNGALFPMGRIIASAAAVAEMKRRGVAMAELLFRHQTGDFGEMGRAEQPASGTTFVDGQRIVSCYRPAAQSSAIFVVTMPDRTRTLLLLPSEFATLR